MLRRIIGKQKSSNKKRKSQDLVFPKSLWKFYFKYAVPGSRVTLVLWALFFLIAASDLVFFPKIQGLFVSLFETPVPENMTLMQFAVPTILTIMGLLLMVDISGLLRATFRGRWSPTVKNRAQTVLTDYVHNQSMSFWTGRMPGQVYSQIGQISSGFAVVHDLWSVLAVFAMLIVNIGLILTINTTIAILFCFVFVLRAVYSWLMIKPLNKASKDKSHVASEESGKTVDSISNFSVVKLFAGTNRERNYLEPVRQKHIKAHIHSYYIQRLLYSVPMIFWDICYGLMLILCIRMYMRGQITVAEIVYTNSVFMGVMGSIAMIVNSIPTISDTLGAAAKAYKELIVPVDVQDDVNANSLQVSHGKIEIKNLSFKYKRRWVLRDFNLTIKPGERVGLVGPSGAGKTTLVNLLMRFYDPVHGSISIDGQDIKNVRQDSLRENIAFIPQEPTMFNRTLRENIEYGKPGATMSEIRTASKRAAAHEFIMGTDKKYESLVGDRGIKLSGGQRQRVAIARAFLKDAPILVLDEATSALDSETEVAIQKSFDELATGRTTVAIAHRLSTLRNMDKIVVLKDGKIVEQGTHKQLLRLGGEYARLWKMQSGGFLQDK